MEFDSDTTISLSSCSQTVSKKRKNDDKTKRNKNEQTMKEMLEKISIKCGNS